MKIRSDLHIHTYYSDGRQSPADVIDQAVKNGLQLVAVTDHDTMLGCEEAEVFANAAGIRIVRGLEVSAYFGEVKLHTLGYGMDEEKFSGFLERLYESSVKRAEDVVYKLNKAGVKITFEEVAAERFTSTSPVHGMHIARACAKKGFAPTPYAFYGEYLAYGKPAFSCVGRPSPEETCAAIDGADGFSVIAHPGRIEMPKEELERLICHLKGYSLGGIEVYYTTHTNEQTTYYKKLAERLSLEDTGGSDTHYQGGRNVIGQPVFYADAELLKRLKIGG